MSLLAGPGLTVVEHTKDAAGVVCKRPLQHHVLLGGMYADTPAQRKLSKCMGHGGYLGCGHCMLLGTVGPTGHGMYFQGYEEQRAAGIHHPAIFCLTTMCSICSSFFKVHASPVSIACRAIFCQL